MAKLRILAIDDNTVNLATIEQELKGKYEVIRDNDERIAFFAHQGFGLSFLSCVLGIDFPHFTTHFDICHSGMTVIEFKNENGYSYPRVLMLSADSHLYKEGLPTRYIGRKPF